ncbi:MAG: family 43 glycosylhydrolase [Mucilaginibacter sp.]|nr:family 43 glycosylhydrolase [Mucilaginibacter sp.]
MHTIFTKSVPYALLLLIQFTAYGQTKQQHIKTVENQYSADLGNGTYLNPVLKGNYADPSVVRDGEDYYLTHSSFDNIPGLTIWHSKDLVNWTPIANALTEFVGGVWAPDIIKFKDKFYIYFPAGGKNWVVTATNPAGPWSKPVDLKIGGIDPGHVATPEGKRYLNLNDGRMAPLSDDGLSVTGPAKKIYEGWPYPKDWITECFCLESPKLTYRNGYYYMTAAQGGTAGPPTSHMVVSARSKTPFGPWENSPNNPIIRNTDRNNKWASIGHGTLVDSPDGKWWMIFHGFEAANRTIGRQILLLPIEWTKDGWFRVPKGADPAKPLKKPLGKAISGDKQLSDNFAGSTLRSQWNILKDQNASNFRVANNTLSIKGIGSSIENTQPLTMMPVNNSYQVTVNVSKAPAGTKGGLVLYYNSKYYVGLEFIDNAIYRLYNGGRGRLVSGISQDNIYLRLTDDHHDLLCYYSLDGKDWKRLDFVTEISGYHHNILGGWGYLRPALFAVGEGDVQFKDFQYQGLD